MIAKTGSAQYAGLLPIEPSDDFFRPLDLKPEPIDLNPEDVPFPHWQGSARKRPRSLARFLIAFCTGVATTLLWQSYGDPARERIANLYPPQLGWLAPRPALSAENRRTPDAIAPATPFDQFNAFDLDAVGQNANKVATTMAAGQEPRTRGTDQMAPGRERIIRNADQIATGQQPMARSADQTAATTATGIPVESRADGASLQPTERFDGKPTEARPPQTLSERGKQSSAASRHDASCSPSASAALRNHPGGWPTWTFRAPGHEGTMCWYAAARPKVSDHRPRVSHYRREMLPEEIETVGAAESGLYAPFVPYGRGGSWEGGLP
jgi:hypothetical protein